MGALKAYDPDLDCVWDERSKFQKITWQGKTVLAIEAVPVWMIVSAIRAARLSAR